MTRTGLEKELDGELQGAEQTAAKMIGMLNNCEVTWEDKLAIKLRELDQAMKESGEAAITRQIQQFLQEIKDKNIDIVDISEAKERLES